MIWAGVLVLALLVAAGFTSMAAGYVAEGPCVSPERALWHPTPTPTPTCRFSHTAVHSFLAYGWLAGLGFLLLVLLLGWTLRTPEREEPVERPKRTGSRYQLTLAELHRRLAVAEEEQDMSWLARAVPDIFGSAAPSARNTAPRVSGSARVPVDEEVRWRVWHRDGMRCRVCGAVSRLTIDHIRPVSLGGTNDESNLQTLCRGCNSRKGARFG